MHFYDFETENPPTHEFFDRLVRGEREKGWLYSYEYSHIAEVDGVVAGSLLSYPGDIYRELRHKTYAALWPELLPMETESEQETDPGEYYLDTLAVRPAFRHRGVARALLLDGIAQGQALGYTRIALVADAEYPHLLRLYASLGFHPAEHRHAFGVDFQRMIFTVG